jgi:hypothetical protein
MAPQKRPGRGGEPAAGHGTIAKKTPSITPAPVEVRAALPAMGFFTIHGTDFLGEARAWARLTHEDRSALFATILYATGEPGAVLPDADMPALTGLTDAQWRASAARLSPTFLTITGGLVSVVRMALAYPKVVGYREAQRKKGEDANRKRWAKKADPRGDAPGDPRGVPPLERNGREGTEGSESPSTAHLTSERKGQRDAADCPRCGSDSCEGACCCGVEACGGRWCS